MRTLPALALALLAVSACQDTRREPMVTFFNARFGLSMRHPPSWTTEQAEQDGVWYRYFLGPPVGPQRKPAVSVTLLAGRLGGSLAEYADVYLAGNSLLASNPADRPGASGRSYLFTSPDAARRHSLLLLQESDRVFGLYAQGETSLFEANSPILEDVFASLTLERPEHFARWRNTRFGVSLGIPSSWRETRSFSGGDRLLVQFTSPPLAADEDRRTVHAALTVTIEPLPAGADLERFYASTKEKLGPSFAVRSHEPWQDGYVDLMHLESSMASSREKRFYRVSGGRGYCLSFVAREDVFYGVSGWCDLIASTLQIGPGASR